MQGHPMGAGGGLWGVLGCPPHPINPLLPMAGAMAAGEQVPSEEEEEEKEEEEEAEEEEAGEEESSQPFPSPTQAPPSEVGCPPEKSGCPPKRVVPGVLYLSFLPPGFGPRHARALLGTHGELGRVFLQPLGEHPWVGVTGGGGSGCPIKPL